jgi:hypothetical protein
MRRFRSTWLLQILAEASTTVPTGFLTSHIDCLQLSSGSAPTWDRDGLWQMWWYNNEVTLTTLSNLGPGAKDVV